MSAWLISRAALHPPVLHLMVAIVAVRACGLSRGVLRYLERLFGHDAAFRIVADVRVGLFTRLERLAPAGLADFPLMALFAVIFPIILGFVLGNTSEIARNTRPPGRES